MKLLIVLAACVLSVLTKELYSTENDNFDVDTFAADADQLKVFTDCFLDTGDCANVPATFKTDIKEAIQQNCDKCTDAQKYILKTYLAGLKEKLPSEYDALKTKFDPEDVHIKGLETVLAGAKKPE